MRLKAKYPTFSDTLERICLFEKLHTGRIRPNEIIKLSFLVGLISQKQYADYLNCEKEYGNR